MSSTAPGCAASNWPETKAVVNHNNGKLMFFETEGENSPTDDSPYVADVETEAPATDTAREAPAAEHAPDLVAQEEAVARARGWVPQSEFRGQPDHWQPAKSFLDRNASLQTEVQELKRTLEEKDREYGERLERISKTTDAVIKRNRERDFASIQEAKRAAVELSDVEEFDRLEREEIRLFDAYRQEDAVPERQAPAAKEPEAQPLLPETSAWIAKNPWFQQNAGMTQVALGFYSEAGERFTTEPERLRYVDERLATTYPDRFKSAPPRTQMPSLEGGGRQPANANSRVNELPGDARAAAERFIKKGYIKNIDEYASMYFEN